MVIQSGERGEQVSREMIVVMRQEAPPHEVEAVLERIRMTGFELHTTMVGERLLISIAADGDTAELEEMLPQMDGVVRALPVQSPYKLVAKEASERPSAVPVGPTALIGDGHFGVIAGPCAVEDADQLFAAAQAVRQAGAVAMRGGAYKPRSSPYSFQGLGPEGLRLLAEAKARTGLAIVTEVLDPRHVAAVSAVADVLQVGARNMQNFALLREVGQGPRPVMLKRGMNATYEEWLMAAEYILASGNPNVILCERGVRSFETYTRNLFDVAAIPVVHELSHLPVIADPSHGSGRWRMVEPLALAAVAAGADGLLVEVHPNPARALSDGAQSLTPDHFSRLMAAVFALRLALHGQSATAQQA